MKFRFDFVTNSSSSSFVAFNIKNKKLAEICEAYWVPVGNNGTAISGTWGAEESNPVVGTPGGGSIAEWFERMLDPEQNDVFEMYNADYSAAIEYIKEHRQEIDEATERSEIASAHVVTDGGGTEVGVEVREKGKIESFGVDEGDWRYEEMGEALWQVLDGWVMEDFMPKLKEFAEDRGMIRESRDIWYKEASDDSIYDSYQPSESLAGKKCCLTGDFVYGSKGKVEKYLTDKGATISSSMTKSTQILIVGALGSAAWSHNNYGSKVEKAMEYRENGADVIIIREMDLFADDPSMKGKLKAAKANKAKAAEETERQKEIDKYYREVDQFNRANELLHGGSKAWLKHFGKLIDKLDFIDLNGKNVVLSGEHPVYYRLKALGANVKNDIRIGGTETKDSVTKKTDYLIVEPHTSGWGKVEAVKKLREAGNTRVKVIEAADLFDLIESGRYYSSQMAAEDKKRKTMLYKQLVDARLSSHGKGYGTLAILMTCLQAISDDKIGVKDRLKLERMLISKQMEKILNTDLKRLLQVYGRESTGKLAECAKYAKTDIIAFEEQIKSIRTGFNDDTLNDFLDIVISMVKEA